MAVYLDEQSGQLPGRNLDVYAADLERIEVLEGPQGTLFGAGAQAGVLRYITNKPKLNATEGNVNAGYATTAGGDPSTNVDATINLPLIDNTLAVRAVIYDERRGGYINNIPGTFSRAPTDRVIVNYFGGVVPPNSGPINNSSEVGNAINPVTYSGMRASASGSSTTIGMCSLCRCIRTSMPKEFFWEEQYDGLGTPLPARSVQLFDPSYDKDRFEDTQLTLNGRIDKLKLVYTGAYLDRNVTQVQDYTNYSRGTYAGYYQCEYPGYPFHLNSATGTIAPTPNSRGLLLLPARVLDRPREKHPSESRIAPKHAGRLARSSHRRSVLGGL